MSHIIDSLFVELGLKNEKFKEGLKESEKAQDDFEGKSKQHSADSEKIDKKAEIAKKRRHAESVKQQKETINNYKKMRDDLIKLFLVFTAGKSLSNFISDTVRSYTELDQFSKQTGVAVKNISGLEVAFKEVGGSADEAKEAIKQAAEANAAFFAGRENALNKAMPMAAGGLGISLSGAYEKGNPLALMMKQADIIKKASEVFKNNPGEVTRRATEMGISSHQLNLYMGGGEALMKRIQAGAAMTGMNSNRARTAAEFNKEFTDTLERLKAVGVSVLMPMLKEITKWLGDKETLKEFEKSLKDISTNLKKVNWPALIKGLGLFSNAVLTFAGWVSKLTGAVLDKNALDDFNLVMDTLLPESMRRFFDQIDIVTGTANPSINNATQTRTYHIGNINVTVPESIAKDRRALGAYILDSVNQANTAH